MPEPEPGSLSADVVGQKDQGDWNVLDNMEDKDTPEMYIRYSFLVPMYFLDWPRYRSPQNLGWDS